MDISIIIPLYKGQKYIRHLEQMLASCITHARDELQLKSEIIFVNDYPEEKISLGGNLGLDEKLIINPFNVGIHQSRVNGLAAATGEYILFLDQDDLIKENYFVSQFRLALSERADVFVCNGWKSRFQVIFRNSNQYSPCFSLDSFSKGNFILSPGQVLIRKSAIPIEWENYILKRNGADDYLLWLLICWKGGTFFFNDSCLYFHTPDRTEDSVNLKAMWESLRAMIDILMKTPGFPQNIIENISNSVLPNKSNQTSSNKFNYMMQDVWMLEQIEDWPEKFKAFQQQVQIEKIGIYGIGYLGEYLFNRILGRGGSVEFVVDQSAIDFRGQVKIFRPTDKLPDINLMIVTVVTDYDDIIQEMKKRGIPHVWSMNDFIIHLKAFCLINES